MSSSQLRGVARLSGFARTASSDLDDCTYQMGNQANAQIRLLPAEVQKKLAAAGINPLALTAACASPSASAGARMLSTPTLSTRRAPSGPAPL